MALEPQTPDCQAALDALTPEQREKFDAWMVRLEKAHELHAFPYGRAGVAKNTGLRCWIEVFLEGEEPEDALADDLEHAD